MKLEGRRIKGLYLVTEDYSRKNFFNIIEEAIIGGVDIVQYRDKSNPRSVRLDVARKVKQICNRYDILFFIDDDVQLAIEVQADGVHIGKDDMPLPDARRIFDGLIGYSTYGDREMAIFAEKNGADYVAFGPFFHTDTKKDADVYDIHVLEGIHKYIRIPVFVIGGINISNIRTFSGYGIDGVAVVSAIFSDPDPERAARELKAALYNYVLSSA
ncbi:thiamine phosphate pyrophosphorylase (yeast THI6) related protein [Thermoplasma acidophilum]|uniref:Thiamine-phosphate synthase n=1 Tax=Thermoplasma acidophilum (strain ATCC 25905 / DSM 1728 / JCM 9062 / NBRC 15155 / AMRC-C165) TaxID=273075 RepID=THIE_THEAC|nr:thiamine phosphate synthase [Thermoplasma acidophilum]Q9HIQ4.1 RecName: Full=Thiamine-phosphate synthase; Short=TP synthase; Short=TPS; AltName: Full=Thiamine-phosphate pyrophosphorylase; Short=TMP pyrophosphorylase; Short=TMP-PPase [Thermoplasma acidophilum DSM 1728]CAC12401.1 thiamine phosphate pyrophosphorylase (yeast THI6) related protein [Thermoplasma acidophilum]